MRILQFKVTGQNLSKDGDFSGIVAGTKGYLYTEYSSLETTTDELKSTSDDIILMMADIIGG